MKTLIRDSGSITVYEEDKAISTYAYFEFEDQGAEFVTVDLSTLLYLKVRIKEPIEKLVEALAKHYGLEIKEMITLDPLLPCTEEFAVECKDNNMICYLLRALYPEFENQSPEGVGICQLALARQIPLCDIRADVAIALTKYARERLQINEPVILIMTDGPFIVIAIATKRIHQ
jgi:hypothetical protein